MSESRNEARKVIIDTILKGDALAPSDLSFWAKADIVLVTASYSTAIAFSWLFITIGELVMLPWRFLKGAATSALRTAETINILWWMAKRRMNKTSGGK